MVKVPIADAALAFKAVQTKRNIGKTVLIADEDAVFNVKRVPVQSVSPANVARIIEIIRGLSLPEVQKPELIASIEDAAATELGEYIDHSNAASQPATKSGATVERRLAAATNLEEACAIILAEQTKKISSLVSVNEQQLDPDQPLADLGLDSLIAIEFKDWLGRSLGADVRVHDILDADSLIALASLVAQNSRFIANDLPEKKIQAFPVEKSENGSTSVAGSRTSKAQAEDAPSLVMREANGNLTLNGQEKGSQCVLKVFKENGAANGAVIKNPSDPQKRGYHFSPNACPKFPLPPLDSLMDAYLTGVKAFTTPAEFANTVRLVEEFQAEGSKGRLLYSRAAARQADPVCENWEQELQLRRGFLDRRIALVPTTSFWFSHPISQRAHSQAERAALLAFTANQFRLKLEAGLVTPVVLNERELTTAYHPYIFNTVRLPQIGSDEMERYPGTDHCVVMWRGHSFKLDLMVRAQPATLEQLLGAFESVLSCDLERAHVNIFTSDNRPTWAEARQALIQTSSENAATVAAIESSAFIVALEEAAPQTATERARQFHFGGVRDAANRWHDKSLQFVVCSNGLSGMIGEHSMLDALTIAELLDDQVTAIRTYSPHVASVGQSGVVPVALPLRTSTALNTRISCIRKKFAATIAGAGHEYLLFDGCGSSLLRARKLSPKSVFQMVVQIASLATFGFLPPCWETVNQAHYHLGRVDIIQVVVPAVAAFVHDAQDDSIPLPQRRALLIEATRAHVNLVNKASRNLGWERNLTALRALAEPHELPELYKDPVHERVRPRLMQSHCFETGMMEKGCISKHPDAIWSHYEVYEGSVYFSAVGFDAKRVRRFCGSPKEAAALMEKIVMA